MTVREVCDVAMAFLFENAQSAPDYLDRAVVFFNGLIPEVFEVNNELRQWKGLNPLAHWPVLQSLDEDVPLETELCVAAVPLGLAANFLLADEEEARSANYFAKYADAVNACMRLRPEAIRDVYSGGAETS